MKIFYPLWESQEKFYTHGYESKEYDRKVRLQNIE